MNVRVVWASGNVISGWDTAANRINSPDDTILSALMMVQTTRWEGRGGEVNKTRHGNEDLQREKKKHDVHTAIDPV